MLEGCDGWGEDFDVSWELTEISAYSCASLTMETRVVICGWYDVGVHHLVERFCHVVGDLVVCLCGLCDVRFVLCESCVLT